MPASRGVGMAALMPAGHRRRRCADPRHTKASLPLRLFMFCASVSVICAVVGYVSLARSEYTDLFVAQSVFIGPALLTSVLAIAVKARLMLRRVEHKRAAVERAAGASGTRRMMPAALRMLARRFVLQHDEQAHKELKNANDRLRYEGYAYMLGIGSEARFVRMFHLRSPSHCRPP